MATAEFRNIIEKEREREREREKKISLKAYYAETVHAVCFGF